MEDVALAQKNIADREGRGPSHCYIYIFISNEKKKQTTNNAEYQHQLLAFVSNYA